MKYLVENGADIHVNNDIPIRLAATRKHFGISRYLRTFYTDIEYAEVLEKT